MTVIYSCTFQYSLTLKLRLFQIAKEELVIVKLNEVEGGGQTSISARITGSKRNIRRFAKRMKKLPNCTGSSYHRIDEHKAERAARVSAMKIDGNGTVPTTPIYLRMENPLDGMSDSKIEAVFQEQGIDVYSWSVDAGYDANDRPCNIIYITATTFGYPSLQEVKGQLIAAGIMMPFVISPTPIKRKMKPGDGGANGLKIAA